MYKKGGKLHLIEMKTQIQNLKQRSWNDMKLLKECKKNLLHVFLYKCQLRWTYEDINAHINHLTSTNIIEDALFQHFDELRDVKMAMFSTSLVYVKEMKKSMSDH